MLLMTARHVFVNGCRFSADVASGMACHPFFFVKNLHRSYGISHRHFLLNQKIGDAVIMSFQFDVVINIHPCFFPAGVFIPLDGQKLQGGLLEIDPMSGRALSIQRISESRPEKQS